MNGGGARRNRAPVGAVIALAFVLGRAVVATEPEPEPGQIARWVRELGADQFAQREAAAGRLLKAGRPALVPLAAAVASADLEAMSRGIGVVRDMLGSEDEALAADAEAFLRRCVAGPEPASRLAEAALEFHALARSEAAREALESLGAVIREDRGANGPVLEVEIHASWRGRTADLVQLTRLRGLASVGLFGVRIDDEALAVLGSLGGVQRIDLFGTGAGPEEEEVLRTRLPDARVDVRKGGRLGVSSMGPAGQCEIGIVEPGSAADQAGLRTRDVVLAVDGESIDDFATLSARLATRAAGEVVKLAIARPGAADGEPERLELEVRLDSW